MYLVKLEASSRFPTLGTFFCLSLYLSHLMCANSEGCDKTTYLHTFCSSLYLCPDLVC